MPVLHSKSGHTILCTVARPAIPGSSSLHLHSYRWLLQTLPIYFPPISLLHLTLSPAGEQPDVWFEAREVWEIRGADLTLSPVKTFTQWVV